MMYCELCRGPSMYIMRFTPCGHIVCSACLIDSIWRNRGDALNCLRSDPVLCWVCRGSSTEVSIVTYRINNDMWDNYVGDTSTDNDESDESAPEPAEVVSSTADPHNNARSPPQQLGAAVADPPMPEDQEAGVGDPSPPSSDEVSTTNNAK